MLIFDYRFAVLLNFNKHFGHNYYQKQARQIYGFLIFLSML